MNEDIKARLVREVTSDESFRVRMNQLSIEKLEQRLAAIEAKMKDHDIMYGCWTAKPE